MESRKAARSKAVASPPCTAAIKILLLFEAAILLIWFGLTKASPATKVKVEHA